MRPWTSTRATSELSGGLGDWRLALRSNLDIEVLAYGWGAGGLLAPLHDLAASEDGVHQVPIFNPASAKADSSSRLRIVNPGDTRAQVTILGVDDRGRSPGAPVEFSVLPGAARTLDAAQLESGIDGQRGLGDGSGKWRLMVASTEAVEVINLLQSPTGDLANLSTTRYDRQDGHPTVPFFPAAGGDLQGLVRVVNRAGTTGEVRIRASDDSGRDYGAVTLSLDANAATHFTSADIEDGNPRKGLSGGLGSGEGDWRLQVSSDLDIDVLAYLRTPDGFLTAMHDVAPSIGSRHRVAFFNPGSNESQVSKLRVVNAGDEGTEVVVRGVDANSVASRGDVRLTVPPGHARTVPHGSSSGGRTGSMAHLAKAPASGGSTSGRSSRSR